MDRTCSDCDKGPIPNGKMSRGRCHRCYMNMRRRHTKLMAIATVSEDGRCERCCLKWHPAAMDFHHEGDSREADLPTPMMQLSWKKLVEELRKTVLLCAGCHRTVHALSV